MAERPTAGELINAGLSRPRGVDGNKLNEAILMNMGLDQFCRTFGLGGVVQKLEEMAQMGLVTKNDFGKYTWAQPGSNKEFLS